MDNKKIREIIYNNYPNYKEAQIKLNISRSQLHRILTGKTLISPTLLASLKKEFPNIDFESLLHMIND